MPEDSGWRFEVLGRNNGRVVRLVLEMTPFCLTLLGRVCLFFENGCWGCS